MADNEGAGALTRYAAAVAVTAAAACARWALDPWLGNRVPFSTYYAAVAVAAWFGGAGPGLLSLALGGWAALFLTISPPGSVRIESPVQALGLVLYLAAGSVIVTLAEQNRRSRRRASASAREADRGREWLRVTLASIGDAVIAADADGRVTFINPVAEVLTGWPAAEAQGRAMAEVFAIVDEQTRRPVDDPVVKVLREGRVVGLANHTLLTARDGTERPVDDSAAPIRDADGSVAGVVLVFRDVTEKRRAELALAESEASYRLLTEGIDLVVWTAGPDGRVNYLNRHGREYAGLTPGSASGLGPALAVAVHPGDLAETRARWEQGRRSGEVFDVECRFRRASDGSYRWHLGRVRPVRGDDGRVARWIGTAIDIEDRKRSVEALRAGEERLRLALDAGRMGTWDWDVAAGTVTWSPGLEAIHGLTPGTFAAYQSDIHPDDLDRVLGSIRRGVERVEEHHQEYRLVWPDGSVHWVEARGRPVTDASGAVCRMIGVCADVTERKRAEDEVRRALDLAEEAGRARDQFLAMLSHELRTPLAPVLLAAAEMLADPAVPESCRESLDVIRRNVELEVRLIDDLLDVTRIIRGKLTYRFEVVDVHGLIRRTLEVCCGEVEEKRLRVEPDLAATRHHVRGDPARLQQVLWNLLKNAVKFTPEGGTVRVRTWDEGGRLGVEVSDTGVGIDPSALTRIFNAFEQEEGSTGRFGGLGLGLAIGKSIVEAHGGAMAASSDGKGRGASFRFTLAAVAPAADPGPAGPDPALDDGGDTAGLRVLLVEDDPMTARIMARLLRRNGYEVTTALTLTSALAVPVDEIDLVVSDIGLPDGTGLDLMRHVAARRDVPGIALTGFGREDDILRSREAGFVAHLTKPVDFAKLDEAIRRVTRGHVRRGGAGLTAST